MILLGYFLALLIGASLAITGSGGAILTMPLLVYLFHISPALATSYTLLIVGVVSLIGAVRSYCKDQVDVKAVTIFGSTSVATVCLIRKFLMPLIPSRLFDINGIAVSYAELTMIVFAVFMLVSSILMLRNEKVATTKNINRNKVVFRFMIYGFCLGIVTGLLGIGGGFIIIPALVLLLQMPMKTAIGTSLSIITLNSFFGFLSSNYDQIDWRFLLSIILISVFGLVAGSAFGKNLANAQLKKAFGCLVLAIGIGIIIKEMVIN